MTQLPDLNVQMGEAEVSDPNRLQLLLQFPESEIAKLKETYFSERDKHKSSTVSYKAMNYKDIHQTDFRGLNLPKPDSAELLSVTTHRMDMNYTAEFFLFCYLNELLPLSDSLAENEHLHVECHEDTIYVLTRIKSKKMLMIASRSSISIKVYKMLGQGKFLELSQSIDLNHLKNHRRLVDVWNSIKKESVSKIIDGFTLEDRESFCRLDMFAEVDLHITLTFKIIGVFVGKSAEKYVKNIYDNCEKILAEQSWKSGKKIVWFQKTNAEGEKTMILPKFFDDVSAAKFFPTVDEAKIRYAAANKEDANSTEVSKDDVSKEIDDKETAAREDTVVIGDN